MCFYAKYHRFVVVNDKEQIWARAARLIIRLTSSLMSSDSTDRDLPPLPLQGPEADNRPYSYATGSSRSRQSSESRRSSLRSFHSELEVGFQQLYNRLQNETRRADDAERRADEAERNVAELTVHLKAINEARITALREASRANEELK